MYQIAYIGRWETLPETAAAICDHDTPKLETLLQLGSVVVTDGGSRFREGLPAANICNLVHKAPAFSILQ